MFNTYGIRSVNTETFNIAYGDKFSFPRPARNVIVTALRINNAILNILGYIPGLSLVSGSVRIAIGVGVVGTTLAIGDRKATSGAIIQHWYDEAIRTGVAQIARGALEALVPFGWVANAALDIIATPFNLTIEIKHSLTCECCARGLNGKGSHPYRDADYPVPFGLLYFV